MTLIKSVLRYWGYSDDLVKAVLHKFILHLQLNIKLSVLYYLALAIKLVSSLTLFYTGSRIYVITQGEGGPADPPGWNLSEASNLHAIDKQD